ncbi:condensin-2 complex subunit D3-like [Lingula anatina]|uniref:Condensin-2 complex subunit D3-like n=1 Tax=Lingula anatina TaxID=7574 RepID=A0A1S3HDQ5_LINAN|nr:condensin-2 complex subunit D3-like [Lingula anatina]|eukprot:XP_013384160.1 condensin-2 complex subunit D3-like [Lingula anatina]
MSADRQLANEIEFDLRKFEEQQEELELQKKQQQQRKSLGGSKPNSPVGSPQPGTSPKAGPPAVTVQSPGQSRPRSIIPKTPVMALNSPATRTGTSSRKMSLVAIAAMNSARKAVEMSNKKQATPTPQRTRRRTTENTPPQMGKNSSADEEEDSSPPGQATFKTPTSKERAKKTPEREGRAVSTPEASLLSNLTFHQGQDTSMMPLSPIPTSMPLRLYSSNIPSTGSKTNKASKEGEDQNPKTIPMDIVCMFSPDKPTPKPRKWNVHSPTSSRIKEKSQDISETTTQDILEVAEPQRRRTRSARSKKK